MTRRTSGLPRGKFAEFGGIMNLEDVIRIAIEQRATDIHLEPKSPVTLRVSGELKRVSGVVESAVLKSFAQGLLSEEQRALLSERGSVDLCRVIGGIQCRINIMKGDRGTGFAIRLLASSVRGLAENNLHPCLGEFINREAGLIILTGPTGSGKSTTLAALIDEINSREFRHIITLESPIEYRHQTKKSLIRQREIGRHTPSYEQGLLDALREDPDVLVVGEMREAEAMRLTLSAAETGHLVLATMHSASSVDAIYRMMMSFPPERQSSVLAQLADTLVAVISQKMTFNAERGLLVPCLEILVGNYPTRNVIRKGEISKLPSILQTGGPEGMYTFERYQTWLGEKQDWVDPEPPATGTDLERSFGVDLSFDDDEPLVAAPAAQQRRAPAGDRPRRARVQMERVQSETASVEIMQEDEPQIPLADEIPAEPMAARASPRASAKKGSKSAAMRIHKDGRIEIPEMDFDLDDLAKQIKVRGEE